MQESLLIMLLMLPELDKASPDRPQKEVQAQGIYSPEEISRTRFIYLL